MCNFRCVRTWMNMTPPFEAECICHAKQINATLAGVFPSCRWSTFEESLSPAVAFAGVVVLSNWTLILLLYRAPEKGPRLAPFAKLSCTGVCSLHHSLVST
jgi:hypothetical protein